MKSLPALAGALALALAAPTAAPAHPKPPPPRWWLQDALCIHHYEGSWTDGVAPYYGGLQMDLGFMAAYGPDLLRRKGTADRWTPAEQLQVAYVGWRHRGWWPWPSTARMCGLL